MKFIKCNACGYVPDKEDIIKTDYFVSTCDTCGTENVCDLCLSYSVMMDSESHGTYKLSKSTCPKCGPNWHSTLTGINRKFWLKEGYLRDKK